MIRKLLHFIFIFMVFLMPGCIKETYDMNMLSKKAHLSPTMAISAIRGDISFSDIVTPDDTIVFDQNNFVKIIFKEDSVIDMRMANFYDLNNMVTFNESYAIGEMSLNSFQDTISLSLDQISSGFSPLLRTQFVALDNGSPHPFPSFPLTDLGENGFSAFTNFEYALFKSGSVDISITNNLTAPLNNIRVSLFNSSDHINIGGDELVVSAIQPGETQFATIDLTDQTVTNSLIAAIVLDGSPGTTNPVMIDLDNNNIQIIIRGRDLKVKSGRVILAEQIVTLENSKDTVTFVPGADIELDKFKVTAGNLSYNIQMECPLYGSFAIMLPTVNREGIPLSETINIIPNPIHNGTISVDNTIADLGTDPLQPFNRMPIEYTFTGSSNGQMINFNESDQIQLDLNLLNPDFDFAKGYFGQEDKEIDPHTLNREIDDILNKITGDFLISSPTIKINYSNSFAIPMEIELKAKGHRNGESVDLDLTPFSIIYPEAPISRDITGLFTVDKTNSSLPALISLLPEEVLFSGLAKMNPQGNTGARDNYIFGNSRFYGSLELEIPMEFSMNNLQFTDTVDNFMKVEGSDMENPIKPENFEFLQIVLTAKNGFPFGVSLNMSLYDSLNYSIIRTVTFNRILEPAQVDNNGKVTVPTESSATFELTKDFFSSIDKADKIIFQFTLVTTGNGSTDVKIYSDYRIDFNAALVLKPDIYLK